MKKDNDEVLAGKVAFTPAQAGMAGRRARLHGLRRTEPHLLPSNPKEVWIIHSEQVRRIYMDVPHSENPKPSWYGESVGHYEGTRLSSTRSARLTSHSLTFTVRLTREAPRRRSAGELSTTAR